MKYYVTSIQYNKEKDAENRSVPFMFTDLLKAKQKFHDILAGDMKNTTLGGSLAIIFNDEGKPVEKEKWGSLEAEPEPQLEFEPDQEDE